jgi:hypothetical protein
VVNTGFESQARVPLGSWKRTCLMSRETDHTLRPPPNIQLEGACDSRARALLEAQCSGFYSRYMYENYYRANVSMDHFREIPAETVPRRCALGLRGVGDLATTDTICLLRNSGVIF